MTNLSANSNIVSLATAFASGLNYRISFSLSMNGAIYPEVLSVVHGQVSAAMFSDLI